MKSGMREVIENKWMRQVIVHGGKPLTLDQRVEALEARFAQMEGLTQVDLSDAEFILREVAAHFNTTASVIRGKRKLRQIVDARWCAVFFVKEFCGYYDTLLAQFFGLDHGTIYHALTQMKSRMKYDSAFARRVVDARRRIEKSFGKEKAA